MPIVKQNPIDLLLKRRSVVAAKLGSPGPRPAELQKILRCGLRVPDHKILAPWRFVVIKGRARRDFGQILKAAFLKQTPDASEKQLAAEAGRFMRAPVVIAVISQLTVPSVVPEWEQVLSAGAACQNILNGAAALGYGAQWITEWTAYNEDVRAALAVADNERIAGLIYIGRAQQAPKERRRPTLDERVTWWSDTV